MSPELYQLGAVAIIFMFTIKEYFGWQKAKKNGNGGQNEMLVELRRMNDNHLHTIQTDIKDLAKETRNGNKDIVNAINDMKIAMIEKLSEK